MQGTSTQTETIHAPLFAGVLTVLLVVALYAINITFPLYSDDVPIFIEIAQQTLGEALTTPNESEAYYRPAVFFVQWLQPPAWAFYSLIIFTHLINTALTGQIARLLGLGNRGQIMAMLGFALMPVATQAITWIASYTHPLVTFFILLYINTSVRYLQSHNIHWLVAAIITGSIAPFAHENGILVVPIAGLVALTIFGVMGLLKKWRESLFVYSVPSIATIIFLIIRSTLVTSDPTTLNPDFIRQNFYFWLQWVTFPTQVIARSLPVTAQTQVIIGAVLFIVISAIMLLIYNNQKSWQIYGMGALWALAAFLPAIIALHPAYVIWSERLLYLAAPAMALMFTVLMLRLPRLAYYISLVMLLFGCTFLVNRYRADLLAHNNLYTDLLREFDNNVPSDSAPLLLNLPSYSAYEQSYLPLGSVRAFMLSDWIELTDFFEVNLGEAYPNALAVHNFNTNDVWANHEEAYYGRMVLLDELTQLISEHDAFYRVRIDGQYQLEKVGVRLDVAPLDSAYTFADAIQLRDISVRQIGDTMRIALDWQRIDDADLPYIVFVHLTCDGVIVDQSDAAPLANLYSFAAWSINEAWTEYRYLNMGDADEHCLGLRVGLYDPNTTNRTTIINPDGTENADGFITQIFRG